MNKDLLFKFIEGKTSINEEKNIRNWMEKSESNFNIFVQIRKEYDIQLLLIHNTSGKRKKNINRISISFISRVSAVIIALILGGIYLYKINNNDEQYNTISVPAGQRVNLILSDNTTLWLNANSEFRYPTKFYKDNRTVYLDGEAYFEVSKDEKKPFIVKTFSGDIHVTGTSFNVEAYSKFNNFVTSLFEGGVDIYMSDTKITSLKPKEKVSFVNNRLLISDITDTIITPKS